ncbi:MAG: hypothetical protein ACI841_002388 [Planctomycetota bacterium]|jgi:hypothetical protein
MGPNTLPADPNTGLVHGAIGRHQRSVPNERLAPTREPDVSDRKRVRYRRQLQRSLRLRLMRYGSSQR